MGAQSPSKQKIFNTLMVAAIIVIVGAAIAFAASLQGWSQPKTEFEKNEYPDLQVVAQNKIGNVNIERSGIAYRLENGDVLCDGDIVETLKGSSIDLVYGDEVESVGELREVAIHIDKGNKISFEYLNEDPEEDRSDDQRAQNASEEGVFLDESGDFAIGSSHATGLSSGDAPSGSSHNPSVKYCTITINCSTILDNLDNLAPGKDRFVPSNGIILAPSTVAFNEGETVFDVLKRVCSAAGIQLEYSYTPLYSSYYIEGINQIYEFDCGNESGWMFQVNGAYPNYGCSSYSLTDGDSIVWNYTCNGYGADLGVPMN